MYSLSTDSGDHTARSMKNPLQSAVLPLACSGDILGVQKTLQGVPDDDALFANPLQQLASDYIQSFNTPYRQLVDNIASQLGTFGDQTLVSINIPVAGAQEMDKIYRCIQSFAFQTVPGDRFEITLLVNYSRTDRDEKHEDIQKTLGEIGRAARDFKHLQIKVAECEFLAPESITIGLLRSLLADATILRSLNAINEPTDIILWQCDADTRAVRQTALEWYIHSFNKNPHILEYYGKLAWSPEGLAQSPRVFGELTAFTIDYMSKSHDRGALPEWFGPNAAIRATAYCWIGGYDLGVPSGVHNSLTMKLLGACRRSSSICPVAFAGSPTMLLTSNRRALAASERNNLCSDQWVSKDTQFGVDNHNIRSRPEGHGNNDHANLSHDEIRSLLAQGVDTEVASRQHKTRDLIHQEPWLLKPELLLRAFMVYTDSSCGLVDRMRSYKTLSSFRTELPSQLSRIAPCRVLPKTDFLIDGWTDTIKRKLEKVFTHKDYPIISPPIVPYPDRLEFEVLKLELQSHPTSFTCIAELAIKEINGQRRLCPRLLFRPRDSNYESRIHPAALPESLRQSPLNHELIVRISLLLDELLPTNTALPLENLGISGLVLRLAEFALRSDRLIEEIKDKHTDQGK